MRNESNLVIYRRWAPVYDLVMGSVSFARGRRRAFSMIELRPGQEILLVGVGTGQDLPFLPREAIVTGIDLSESMLAKARAAAIAEGRDIKLLTMNAEGLRFPDGSFDVVVMSLILSVVEHPEVALREACRVAKEGGAIIVFDKFLPASSPSMVRRALNSLTSAFGTDINRRFESMAQGLPLKLLQRQPAMWRGAYEAILLRKATLNAGAAKARERDERE